MIRARTTLICLTATSLLVAAAACGDDGTSDGVVSLDDAVVDDPDADVTGDLSMEDAALAYADCMRGHGIDMPDPDISPDGGVGIVIEGGGDDATGADLEAAEAECSPLLDQAFADVERDPEAEAEMLDHMTEVARCMRARGHDMPDPQIDEHGGIKVESEGDGDTAVAVAGRLPDDGAGDLFDSEFGADLDQCYDDAGTPDDGERDG